MPNQAVARSERRTLLRRPSRLRLPCRLTRATGEGPWQATVRNISPGGVGLITGRPFKAGMLLTLEPPTPTAGVKPKLLKVTHAAPQPGNKWWVVGGVFASPLSEEEMAAFL
jgi:hypothetical protein